jgi:hypothetical protein
MDGVIVATPKKMKKNNYSIAFITLNITIKDDHFIKQCNKLI